MTDYFLAVLIYSSVQLIAFSIVLIFNKKYGVKANRVLAVFLIVVGLGLLSFALEEFHFLSQSFLFGYVIAFLGGPFLYFYVRAYLSNEFTFQATSWFHFIPFLLQLLLWVFLIIPLSPEEKFTFLQEHHSNLSFYKIQRELSFAAITLFYIYLICRDIQRYHTKAREAYSYTNVHTLKWFYSFILLLTIVPFISSLIAIYFKGSQLLVLSGLFSVFTFLIMLVVLMRPEIYQGIGIIAPVSFSKKKGNSLSLEEREKIHKRLLRTMENEQVFLNSDITLSSLSNLLETNPNYLSQSINSLANKSFFDFINSHRIEYAKAMLINKNYSKYTIEGIAKESGFRSRSAFYNAFKKFNNSSPQEYMNKHRGA